MVTGWSPSMRDNIQSSCNMVNQTLPVPLYFATLESGKPEAVCSRSVEGYMFDREQKVR